MKKYSLFLTLNYIFNQCCLQLPFQVHRQDKRECLGKAQSTKLDIQVLTV